MTHTEALAFLREHATWLSENWSLTPEGREYRAKFDSACAALSQQPPQPTADAAVETQAARDVLAERRRQVEVEGWTAVHDDEHDSGEMAAAASAYALAASDEMHPLSLGDGGFDASNPPPMWCWDPKWWKPAEPRRMLVKAGALILAEIERLDRAAKDPT